MRTQILLTIALSGLIMSGYSQKATMTLTFTALKYGQHVVLDSILVENLTTAGDTTLYAPDTALVLNFGTVVGLGETGRGSLFSVTQNYPNPIEGKTTVNISLPSDEDVSIVVSDIMGREMIRSVYRLDRGNHSFTFIPGSESMYFMTACIAHQCRTIKMLNALSQPSGNGICQIEYNGQQQSDDGEPRFKSSAVNFMFNVGDQLKYTGYSAFGSVIIFDAPTKDHTYTFQYNSSYISCPGLPTITDIEGNIYNTVLIGNQCWMKENLKTTKYRNGTPIPNITDSLLWISLTTPAYACYNNSPKWKDHYGALYNWYATVDTNGLCPAGWHVPSNNEWIELTNFIGGTGSPYGSKLKSCRQLNSSLGSSCNTFVHPRWDQDNTYNGTDDYGFSGLPGGYRSHGGYFYNLGYLGYWWASTDNSVNYGYNRRLYCSNSAVTEYLYPKINGFSVRCVQDQ